MADEDDDSSDEDSDYEFTGGDLALYDSALDEVDELLFIQNSLGTINQADSSYFNRLLSGMTQDELN